MEYAIAQWEAQDEGYNGIIYNSQLWLTQKTIAKILNITVRSVSEQLSNLEAEDIGRHESFKIAAIQGKRIVRRGLKHYPLSVACSVAVRSRKSSNMDHAIRVAEYNGCKIGPVMVSTKKEHNFCSLLVGALSGITTINRQYRIGNYFIDFFIPSINMAIEYDEEHHQAGLNKSKDAAREQEISLLTPGIRFIRVVDGAEIEGLNAILKEVIKAL